MSNDSTGMTASTVGSLAGLGLVFATALTSLAMLAVLAAVGLGAVSLALGSVVEPSPTAAQLAVVVVPVAAEASAPLAQATYHQRFGLPGGE